MQILKGLEAEGSALELNTISIRGFDTVQENLQEVEDTNLNEPELKVEDHHIFEIKDINDKTKGEHSNEEVTAFFPSFY